MADSPALLHARGALTNFGHRRPDEEQERFDAARWLAAKPQRYLLIRREARNDCFANAAATSVGFASRQEWELVAHSGRRARMRRARRRQQRYGPRVQNSAEAAVAVAPPAYRQR